MTQPAEPVMLTARSSREGVVCEIKILAPADAFRGEITVALEMAEREIADRIRAHYAGGTQ